MSAGTVEVEHLELHRRKKVAVLGEWARPEGTPCGNLRYHNDISQDFVLGRVPQKQLWANAYFSEADDRLVS